jgi:hypothetical protein
VLGNVEENVHTTAINIKNIWERICDNVEIIGV